MGMRAKGTDAWLDALLWASFIVPAVLFAGVAAFDYRHVFDSAEDNVRRTIDIMYEHALKVFETHELVIGQVERRIRGMSWDEIGRSDALRQELRRLDAELPQIASVWVIDPTGRV